MRMRSTQVPHQGGSFLKLYSASSTWLGYPTQPGCNLALLSLAVCFCFSSALSTPWSYGDELNMSTRNCFLFFFSIVFSFPSCSPYPFLHPAISCLQTASWHVVLLAFPSKSPVACCPQRRCLLWQHFCTKKIINTSSLSKPRCFGWEEVPPCWVRSLPAAMYGFPLTDSSPTGSNRCPTERSSQLTLLNGT